MIRVVLFDIDGTLIRTGGAGVRAFERTFAALFGIPGATENVSFAGRTDTSLVRECFRQFDIEPSPEHFRSFFDAYVFFLQHFLSELDGETCPGVGGAIEQLRGLNQPPLLGLLTGNIRLGAEIKLRHYQLWEPFRSGAFGDDHENRNCLAAVAQERAQKILGRELAGEEILVIGDTPLDIECARAIKAKVLAVSTGGYSYSQLQAFNPTWTAETLRDVDVAELCK